MRPFDEYESYMHEALHAEEIEIQRLQDKLQIVNEGIQEISDFLSPGPSENEKYLKICFPSGYIRNADTFRNGLGCIEDNNIKSNIAYSLILSDLNTWLLNRTTIQGVLKEMIIKNEIHLMASICETIIFNKVGKRTGYNKQVEKMFQNKMISEEARDGLHWLWEIRRGIHLFDLDEKEFDKYTLEDFTKSKEVTNNLIKELNKYQF